MPYCQFGRIFRPGTPESGVFEEKLNDIAVRGASSSRKRSEITSRQRQKPTPSSAKGTCAARGDCFNGQIAGEESARKRLHQKRVRPHRRRKSAPTSLTLCEHVCFLSSAAHSTKSQLFTIPWGNPREAQIEPTQSVPTWSTPPSRKIIAARPTPCFPSTVRDGTERC